MKTRTEKCNMINCRHFKLRNRNRCGLLKYIEYDLECFVPRNRWNRKVTDYEGVAEEVQYRK